MMRGGLLAWCWILAIGCGSSEQNSGDDDDARGGSGGSAVGAGGSAGASTPTAGAAGSATASGGQAGGPTNAGSGGTATAGSNGGGNAATSGSAGSSGSAGGERPDPSSASELDACLYYLRSVCNRQFNECNERPAELHPCPDVEQTCPDRYFSDGSEFTVASLIACGDYWRTRSCDEIASGVDPACLTRGSLLLAEPCMFSTQCASLWCSRRRPGRAVFASRNARRVSRVGPRSSNARAGSPAAAAFAPSRRRRLVTAPGRHVRARALTRASMDSAA